jgi:hypothetical protein
MHIVQSIDGSTLKSENQQAVWNRQKKSFNQGLSLSHLHEGPPPPPYVVAQKRRTRQESAAETLDLLSVAKQIYR